MKVNVNGRKIMHFRTHVDPGITVKPACAFGMKDMNLEAEITPAGIYVKDRAGAEHIVPFANVVKIKLLPEEKLASEEKTEG